MLSSLANPVAIPFFDRVPRRLLPAVRRACDRIETSRDGVSEQHKAFLLDIAGEGFPAPTFDEFRTWFEEVRLGRFSRTDYEVKSYEPTGAIEMVFVRSPEAYSDPADRVGARLAAEDRVRKAHAIIVQAVRLQQAMLDAGYSSESCEMEDQIVAEAIKDYLGAEAADWGEALNLDYAPSEIGFYLLDAKDRDQGAKLLDVLATHMQRELCLAIVNGSKKDGAA